MSSQPSRRGRPGPRILAVGIAALLAAGCAPADRAVPLPSAASPAAVVPSASAAAPDASRSQAPSPAATPTATTRPSPPDPTPVGVPTGDPGAGGSPAPSAGTVTGALPPPVALALPAGGTVQGALGGYTWHGRGTDAPWIVPSAAHAVRSGGPFTALLDPGLAITGWVVRWAPVDGEAVGDVAGYAEGTARPITFTGPTTPGTFGLSLELTFPDGGRAAWYWRLEPHV